MKRCNAMVDTGRRLFLAGAGFTAAGAAAVTVMTAQAKAAPGAARVDYPSNRLANVSDLKVDEPLQVAYPDADAPGVLLKFGKRVATGAGPDGNIVGFTLTRGNFLLIEGRDRSRCRAQFQCSNKAPA